MIHSRDFHNFIQRPSQFQHIVLIIYLSNHDLYDTFVFYPDFNEVFLRHMLVYLMIYIFVNIFTRMEVYMKFTFTYLFGLCY